MPAPLLSHDLTWNRNVAAAVRNWWETNRLGNDIADLQVFLTVLCSCPLSASSWFQIIL
jgi:hypothetical protein